MRLFEGTEFDIPPRCDRCEELEKDCECPPEPVEVERVPREKQALKIFPERRKHGRTVTCIKGVHEHDLADVLTELKDKFGTGGTIKNEIIELQGDHGEKAKAFLKSTGFKIR